MDWRVEAGVTRAQALIDFSDLPDLSPLRKRTDTPIISQLTQFPRWRKRYPWVQYLSSCSCVVIYGGFNLTIYGPLVEFKGRIV